MNKEQNLVNQIQRINSNIKVYGRYLKDFEVWIVCLNKKDYKILEKACNIINDYMLKYHVNVDCVFISDQQIIKELPAFKYTSLIK